MAARIPEEQYLRAVARADALAPDDNSLAAISARSQVARFRDWSAANEARTHLRWQWHRFFADYDVLLTPIMATSAIEHDHRPMGERTVNVNGEPQDYFRQVFWSGLTGVSYLPSTIVPTGPDDSGLPIGVQIAGPEYGDLITIGVAQLLEREGFAFRAPPGFDGA